MKAVTPTTDPPKADPTASHRKKMPSRASAAREKSAPGCRASEDRPTPRGSSGSRGLSAEARARVPFWKPQGPCGLCQHCSACARRRINRAQTMAHLFTTRVSGYFKPTVETYCSEKRFFQNVTADKAPGHPGALTEMDETKAVFTPADTTSICSPWAEESFQLSGLIEEKHVKATAAIDSDSSDGSGQVNRKSPGKESPV